MAKIKKGIMKKIIYLASWHWEGAYVLKTLFENNLPCSAILIQSPWWRRDRPWGYSLNYWRKFFLDKLFGLHGKRYYSITKIAKDHRVKIIRIKNINNELVLLRKLNPRLIIVVGSRIIKKNIIDGFKDKIVNFHTGVLPEYRGPYSEFWAMYDGNLDKIGTTIHLIDEGIDSGKIIGKVLVNPKKSDTPETIHIQNVKIGAKFLAKVVKKLLSGKIRTIKQDESIAKYHSYPETDQIIELEEKLGKRFNINFAE